MTIILEWACIFLILCGLVFGIMLVACILKTAWDLTLWIFSPAKPEGKFCSRCGETWDSHGWIDVGVYGQNRVRGFCSIREPKRDPPPPPRGCSGKTDHWDASIERLNIAVKKIEDSRALHAGMVLAAAVAPAGGKSLREMQASLPWTIHYNRDFRASPMAWKDFGHALLHVTKASGKIAAAVNDAEHAGSDFADVEKYIADLVICALRMANTCPGRTIDLQDVTEKRIANKNTVNPEAPASMETK